MGYQLGLKAMPTWKQCRGGYEKLSNRPEEYQLTIRFQLFCG